MVNGPDYEGVMSYAHPFK